MEWNVNRYVEIVLMGNNVILWMVVVWMIVIGGYMVLNVILVIL